MNFTQNFHLQLRKEELWSLLFTCSDLINYSAQLDYIELFS
jgi:hypothetical protein